MYKDSIGQEVKIGDYIAYKNAYSHTEMEHAEIIEFSKNGKPLVEDMDEDFTKNSLTLKSKRTICVKTFIQEDI